MYYKIRSVHFLLPGINNLQVLFTFKQETNRRADEQLITISADCTHANSCGGCVNLYIPTVLHSLCIKLRQIFIYWKKLGANFLTFDSRLISAPAATRLTSGRQTWTQGRATWREKLVGVLFCAGLKMTTQSVLMPQPSCHPRSWRNQQMTNLKHVHCLELFFKVSWCVLTQTFP